ncbi:PAS domain-containing protein [Arcobacter sp. FWKO B]|uniref:PAS domain-containing protein n=1 Tax=Arcobacter sp. FWKO B TaxID=2593672 RepID=UPI0018A37B48|nr:PAS domain-containing protein [Arcobacter sp. FWKO B]QOG12668.1 PAS domain-containing protein [Arcobacter sp. FWKO B]
MRDTKVMPTQQEFELNKNDFIVSKTNSKGIITYGNKIFIKMSGYGELELLNKNHNMIRHTDMPKIAFKIAWDLIQNKKEFFGFVKNLRKDGGYYWVFANITPDFDSSGNIIGYTSVRRKANQQALKIIIPLYQELIKAEQSGGMKASMEILQKLLDDKNMSYNELIIALQGSK